MILICSAEVGNPVHNPTHVHVRMGLQSRHNLFAHVRVTWMQKLLMFPWHKVTCFWSLMLFIHALRSVEETSERPASCPISQTYPWHGFKASKALRNCGIMSQGPQVRQNMLSVLTAYYWCRVKTHTVTKKQITWIGDLTSLCASVCKQASKPAWFLTMLNDLF